MTPQDRRRMPAERHRHPGTPAATSRHHAFGPEEPEEPEFQRTWKRLRREHGRTAGNVFSGIYLGQRRDG
jgi:hypothetical protein